MITNFILLLFRQILKLPLWFYYLLTVIFLFKLSLSPSFNSSLTASPYSTSVSAGVAFPTPVNYASANLLPALTFKFFGMTSDATPKVAFVILLVFLHILIYLLLLSRIHKILDGRSKKLMILIMILLPMNNFLIRPLDYYDIYIYLGIAICFYALNSYQAVFLIGAIVFTLAHPEQALASFFALFLLTLNSRFRNIRTRALLALAITLIVNVFIQIWYFAFGFRGSRVVEIVFSFPNTLQEHMADIPQSLATVYAMYGIIWLFIIKALRSYPISFKERLYYSVSLIGMPFFFWFVTSDGLRCVVPMTSLLALVLTNSYFMNSTINSGGVFEGSPNREAHGET